MLRSETFKQVRFQGQLHAGTAKGWEIVPLLLEARRVRWARRLAPWMYSTHEYQGLRCTCSARGSSQDEIKSLPRILQHRS